MNKKEIKGMIICGFPGVGKTTVESITHEMGIYRYCDLESTPYRLVIGPNGEVSANPNFCTSYVDAIENLAGPYGYEVVMVSTHKEVREELRRRGAPYIIVAPEKWLKDEYLLRYVARRSDYSLIQAVYERWDEWLDDIEIDGAPVIHLNSGQWLANVIVPEIIRENLSNLPKENTT